MVGEQANYVDDLSQLDATWERHASSLTAAEAAHAALRDAIVDGRLRPGFRLSEVGLARRFSISRTPVREALLRLESERLVERNGRGGLVVGDITPDEIVEIYVVREALNGLVARLAAEQARPGAVADVRWLLERLRECAAAHDYRRMATVNLQFHEALCATAGNGLLVALIRQVHDRVQRIPGTTFSYPGRAEKAIDEHEQVLRAIEAHDPDAAESLARSHMARARELRILMLRQDRLSAGQLEGTAGARPQQRGDQQG